ncbi:hypothetical protein BDV11DRAFT_185178 [Aspergillus similis]
MRSPVPLLNATNDIFANCLWAFNSPKPSYLPTTCQIFSQFWVHDGFKLFVHRFIR